MNPDQLEEFAHINLDAWKRLRAKAPCRHLNVVAAPADADGNDLLCVNCGARAGALVWVDGRAP